MGAANAWTNPLSLELEMSPRHFVPGDAALLRVEVAHAGGGRSYNGELQLVVSTLEGIGLFGGPVYQIPLIIRPGAQVVREGTLTIPHSFEPGGYRAEVRLAIDGDDVLAADALELFVRGDGPGTLVVNELMASNDTTIADEWGEYDDWVELYNDTDAPSSLAGLYLSDDLEDEPFKWALPAVAVAPRDHLLIWCDNDPGQGALHAAFKLSAGGEEVAVVTQGPQDEPVVVDWIVFGPQSADLSMGRYPDGLESLVTLDGASPDAENSYTPR